MKLEVTLDCLDLEAIASFWAAAFDSPVEHAVEERFASLRCGDLTLNLQKVTSPKDGRNRMHLDLLVGDLLAEVARLESLGATATETHEEFGQTWFVLCDPEGNEFCVAKADD